MGNDDIGHKNHTFWSRKAKIMEYHWAEYLWFRPISKMSIILAFFDQNAWCLWPMSSFHMCWLVLWWPEMFASGYFGIKHWLTRKYHRAEYICFGPITKIAIIFAKIDQNVCFLWLISSIHMCWLVLWWLEVPTVPFRWVLRIDLVEDRSKFTT